MRSLFTRLIFAALIVCSSAHAAFTVASSSLDVTGQIITVTMNGTYVSGATTGCFATYTPLTGQFNQIVSVTPTVSSSIITIVVGAPAYANDTPDISMAASPTCGLVGTTGTAGSTGGYIPITTNNSNYYAAGDSHWSASIRPQGNPSTGTDGNGYHESLIFNSPIASIDFVQTGSGTMYLWTILGVNAFSLLQDGAIVSRQVYATGTSYGETAFSLASGTHSYSIRMSSTVAQGIFAMAAIRCPTCSFGTLPAALPIVTACGSSYVDLTGGGSATANADQTNWGLLYEAIGLVTQGFSNAGTPLYPTLESQCPPGMVLSGGGTPAIGWLEPDGNGVGVTSQPNYTTAVTTVLTNIAGNGHPPTTLFLADIYNGNYGGGEGTCVGLSSTMCSGLYNGWMYTGFTSAAIPGSVFLHTQALPNGGPDWMNITQNSSCAATPGAGSGDMMPNNHPCPATQIGQWGYGNIVNRQIPIFQGVLLGYSFTASTTTGYGCSTVSLTIPGGNANVGYPIWADTITATSSNASDSLTFSSSSSGTHSASLANSVGLNPVVLSVCGASGTRTISWSNLPDGWVAPSSASLTIGAATYVLVGKL